MNATLIPTSRHTEVRESPNARARRRVIADIDITGATPEEMIAAGQTCMRAGGEVWLNRYPDGRTLVSCHRATEPGATATGIVTDDGHALECQPVLEVDR